jgi:hypothetical protein
VDLPKGKQWNQMDQKRGRTGWRALCAAFIRKRRVFLVTHFNLPAAARIVFDALCPLTINHPNNEFPALIN